MERVNQWILIKEAIKLGANGRTWKLVCQSGEMAKKATENGLPAFDMKITQDQIEAWEDLCPNVLQMLLARRPVNTRLRNQGNKEMLSICGRRAHLEKVHVSLEKIHQLRRTTRDTSSDVPQKEGNNENNSSYTNLAKNKEQGKPQ